MKRIIKVEKMEGPWTQLGASTGYPKLAYAMGEVKRVVSAIFPELAGTKLFVGCPHTMEKHSHHQVKDTDRSGKNWRAFMHTGHFDNTICVHPHAEKELKMDQLIGMVFHEFGHRIADLKKVKNTQKNADLMIEKYFGIKIRYRGPGRIQYVRAS